MKPFSANIFDRTGAPLGDVTVSVFLTGTQSLATIYSDNGITSKSNPFTTDALGRYSFFSAGRFRLDFTKTGHTIPSLEIVLEGAKCMLSFGTGAAETVAANATVFLGPRESSAGAGGTSLRTNYKSRVRRLRCQSSLAPGVGQTFVYTFYIGSDTTLTATTSGGSATTASDLTHEVVVNDDTSVWVKLVTSATATVTEHTCTVEAAEEP